MNAWTAVKEGRVRLAVGTRSSIFAPVPSLGLIVILDEENYAYKQEQSPFYHVREIARMRSQVEGCQVLVVSPTPSAEVWWQTRRPKTSRIVIEPDHLGKMQMIDMSNYKP